jgi:hypothetical protein
MLKNWLYAIALVLLTLVASEGAFRCLLFSNLALGERFRNPGFYANYFTDDDYWKLNYRFKTFKTAKNGYTHPLLGWAGTWNPRTYLHNDTAQLKGRRPVLMYGDSFGSCATKKCFQDYFNEDPAVNEKCAMLNYSTGAYGVDQIYLLYQKSIDLFKKPIVVYSLLTEDLDRASRQIFVGQKPFFKIEKGQLVLSGVPVDPDPHHFFATHPPEINSYLFKLFTHGGPEAAPTAHDLDHFEYTKKIGRAILHAAIDDMKRRRLDFIVTVFVGNWDYAGDILGRDEDNWRLQTIVSVLDEENVPYIVTKKVLRDDMVKNHIIDPREYFRPLDGHPNDQQNALIYEAIKNRLPWCL